MTAVYTRLDMVAAFGWGLGVGLVVGVFWLQILDVVTRL